MVERSDERMERSGHGTKWPKDGTKWFGTKWSWNEVTGYRGELLPGKGGGVGSCCLFRRQGANCCIPVEMEEMLTYNSRMLKLLRLDKVVSLILPVHFLRTLIDFQNFTNR